MLPRVLEPEAMDTPEEARDYDAMDHSVVNARFVADFLTAHGACGGGEVVDIGCGPAQIAIALCQTDPNARVLGLDLADAMLSLARRNVRAVNLDARIRFAHGDAKQVGLADGTFEAVISNTIIHHIPDPGPVCREMLRLVQPGGTLFVRDLARPADLSAVAQLVDAYAGSEPEAARALFEASLHAALTVDEVRAIVVPLGGSPEDVIMTSDRHWTWTWKRPV